MGSSGTRKPSDAVRIQPVKKAGLANLKSDAGTGAGGGGNSPNTNNMCPIRFRVKLARQDIEAGVELALEDVLLTAPALGAVGKISAQILKRLVNCSGLGINYIITTVVDRGTCYAEFSQ